MIGKINIVTISPHTGTDQVIRDIRHWCENRIDPNLAGTVDSVTKDVSLEAAVSRIADFGDDRKKILVPIGFNESDVVPRIDEALPRRPNLEIIIRPPRPASQFEQDEPPSSSMFDKRRIVNVQNTIPAIRKSILRLKLCDQLKVVRLDTVEQLRKCFLLRHKVWKDMGYLPEDRDCADTEMELDYTDAAAVPIAAFDNEGRMLGCARLVFARRDEISDSPDHSQLIEDLIRESGSSCLNGNFTRPPFILHPFVLLDAFDKFKRYYRHLVRLKISKAEVSRVIVAAEFRNQGLGEILVDSLISMARKQHVSLLFLACQEKHREFYKRCGFHALPGLWCERFASVNKPSIAMACVIRKREEPVIH